jgi:hypothetical protein
VSTSKNGAIITQDDEGSLMGHQRFNRNKSPDLYSRTGIDSQQDRNAQRYRGNSAGLKNNNRWTMQSAETEKKDF